MEIKKVKFHENSKKKTEYCQKKEEELYVKFMG